MPKNRTRRHLMDSLRTLLSRLASLLRRDKLDAALDEELHSHIDFAIEENLKRGMSRHHARTAALREFGGITQIRESYRTQRGIPLLEQFVRDLRYACRQLLRSPGFALTAILTLALGLGANAAVFSLIDALLLRPLAVPHAENLAVLSYGNPGNEDLNYSFSAPVVRVLEKRRDVFESLGAFSGRTMQVRGSSGTVEVEGALVSGQFFPMLETRPLLGRYLTPQDDQKGGAAAQFGVVISEGFWKSWFSAAPDVVGRKLVIANSPFVVVGVMPASFIGADPTTRPQFYVPLWAEPVIDAPYDNIASGIHFWWLRVLARPKAGVTLQQAAAALKVATKAINQEACSDADWLKEQERYHAEYGAETGSAGYSYLQKKFSRPLAVVFALCTLMLLLACLNLASLLMARSTARERELATRLALGASRHRLMQQLLVESLLLAVLGTAAGLMAAPLVSGLLQRVLLGANPTAHLDTAVDVRIFGFAALAAIVSTLLIGFVPALRATSRNLNEQVKTSSHGSGANTAAARGATRLVQRILMSTEVALALLLVAGAGLMAASLTRLYRTGLGFEPKGLANLSLNMNKQALDGEPLVRWYQQYGEALAHQPGVKSVSFASITPMEGSVWTSTYRTSLSGSDKQIHMDTVSPAFFETMRIPLLAGRDFRWTDSAASGRKVILNQAAAKALFPGRNAIGQQVFADDARKVGQEVVGVVGDIHYDSIQKPAPPEAYLAITQDDGHKPSYTAVVRSEGPAVPLAAAARSLAARMSPEIPPPVMISMSDQLDDSISSERMMAMLAIFFAVCALLVTAIGLYGTLAYATARRTSEIGIRMALGAQRMQVVVLVFRENASVAITGSVAGLIAALMASKLLASFLYSTSVRDPWVMSASVLTLIAVACAASLLPALRASKIEPIQALRAE